MNIELLEIYGKVVEVLGEQAHILEENKVCWIINLKNGYLISLDLSEENGLIQLDIVHISSCGHQYIMIDNCDKIDVIIGFAYRNGIQI